MWVCEQPFWLEELLPRHPHSRHDLLLLPLLFPSPFPFTLVIQLPSRGESDGLGRQEKSSKPLQMNFREVLRSIRVGSNVLRRIVPCCPRSVSAGLAGLHPVGRVQQLSPRHSREREEILRRFRAFLPLSLLTSRRRRCSSSSGSARPSGTCSRAWSAGSSTASIGRISRSPSRSAISSACHYSPFSSRPLSPRASPSPSPSSSTRCFSPCSACCSTSPDRRSKASCSTSIARSAEEPPRPSGRCSITLGGSWGRSCLRRC